MQTDDDLQTTLSKWPFFLGDGLLVATALAIAFLGDWQLTNWQVAACVISVALGAGLYVLPYIVEYRVRVREEAEDRSAELRILQRQVASAEGKLEAFNQRIEAIDLNLKEFGNQGDERTQSRDFSGPLEALEARITPLVEAGAGQRAEMDALHERMSAISELVTTKPDLARIDQLAAELEKLQLAIAALTGDSAESQPPPAAPEVARADVEAHDDAADNSPVDADHKASVSRPVRSPRKRRTVEPRMLQRAIEQKQDSTSAAVSRIIGGKPKEKAAEPAEPVESPAGTPVSEVPAVADDVDAPESAGTAPLFAEAALPPPVKIRRKKKRGTAVIASVFIGIGNKPYLRGSGAELNWEQGMAMEFEEIGKWLWIAPDDLTESIELQVYRNDEDPDKKGKYTLEPGQRLEISPEF